MARHLVFDPMQHKGQRVRGGQRPSRNSTSLKASSSDASTKTIATKTVTVSPTMRSFSTGNVAAKLYANPTV